MGINIARIHRGQYDTENQLLNLRKNAIRMKNAKVLDAANMRLKKVFPEIYQRIVGPLTIRERDKRFKCYCNNPKSLYDIHLDIINEKVPPDALTCDACWQEDICVTWGYYGYSSKVIPVETWRRLCDERGLDKFVLGI